MNTLQKKLLYSMKKIRQVELAIAAKYSEQQMRCPVHLSIGQEAVAAAVGACLEKTDSIVSGHRAHAHYLGVNGSLKGMIAEIYGKVTGCSKGKGGSMHLIDKSVGFMGSTAIVGGTIPVGVGFGLAIKKLKQQHVACVFLGDGAIEEGAFYESANFAALHKLPVLFICENNEFSVYSPLEVRQPKQRLISEMVAGMGIESAQYDGNDVELIHQVTTAAVQKIKAGQGPQFLEFATWRWLEHCGPNEDDDLDYRCQKSNSKWRDRDPVQIFEKKLMDQKLVSESEIKDLHNSIDIEIKAAFEFALTSAFPTQEDLFEGIYG
ncbi:MAG: thiamine pyrophosphate-dependent dehydrogenase E1 component subunit alpha [Bdellovibrionaceae bacterium]|nr:thiamine pyrophosphate-dependent dehydrogenase E1 component subunit alpha [Bdellovibrio sp.]